MSIWWVINIVLFSILAVMLLSSLRVRLMTRRSATILTQEEFQEGMRKAQVIDVRERDEFKAKHILGARSFPYTQLKEIYVSLRKDQPIYIYDQSRALSARTANFLRKKGYTNLFILKGGLEEWTGKIKEKKLD
ncbi:rhodanese-like domain-containing protein [Enterococcus sp. ALS3]|uniref:Rhodanese-like domain-containing protein n=1 Tax=Enterococcus alishanensis TaxID=1303817 RepID=A0ABS6TAM4_9ENTE|nr:rhodanese-like domain-containing protein [Enterococcus alishanensis]MBV7389940.1 rhodanese-like domain-containing protein [Enterococcus alishanensis]